MAPIFRRVADWRDCCQELESLHDRRHLEAANRGSRRRGFIRRRWRARSTWRPRTAEDELLRGCGSGWQSEVGRGWRGYARASVASQDAERNVGVSDVP